ncbi:unnamed protein product, partial [Miscanthus lutarioriparius]
ACSSGSCRMPARRTSSTCSTTSSGRRPVSTRSTKPCSTRSLQRPVASSVLHGGGCRHR